MGIISSLIPILVIISIIFSIVSKAKQAQNKSSKTGPAAKNTQVKSSSLQEIIRRQIEEQRTAVSGISSQSAAQSKPVQAGFPGRENPPADRRYSEGDAINRQTLEGTPVEMQRHSHNAHIGGSYNEGDALDRYSLEGSPIFEYEDKFSLDERAKVTKRGKKAPKSKKQAGSKNRFKKLEITQDSVVNGIIMSEILGSRGGRRAAK